MIRLTVEPDNVFTLAVEGAPDFRTLDSQEVTEQLGRLGVAEPAALVEQAQRWRVIDILEHAGS